MMANRIKRVLCVFIAAMGFFCACTGSAARGADARNIILIIGDGMQLEHEVATSNYLYGEDFALVWHAFPYQNFVTTWNIDTYNVYAAAQGKPEYDPEHFDPLLGYDPQKGGDKPSPARKGTKANFEYFFPGSHPSSPSYLRAGPATDSAASATAMATGIKTRKGRISWDAAGEPGGALLSISEIIQAKNRASIGAVSTVPFSHATPAAFSSHNNGRNNFYTGHAGYQDTGIAEEILTATMPDVVIAGGHPAWDNPGWDPDKGFISQALYQAMPHSETYVFVERRQAQDGRQLLDAGAAQALESGKKLFGLFGGKDGSFEAPVPQHAPGAPHIVRATQENPLLEHVVETALTILSRNENGFFIIIEQGDIDWANHANSFRDMIGTLWGLNQAVLAATTFVDRPGDSVDWDNTLLIVTADHANSYMRMNPNKKLGPGELPGQLCEKNACQYPDGQVRYSTNGHTNELVGIYAKGAGTGLFEKYEGAWYPGTRLIDNTHIFAVMREAAIQD